MSLEAVRNIATTLAALTGAGVAVLGLQTWRRQLKGNTEYDLARRLYRKVLAARDAITVVRAPFVSAGESWQATVEAALAPDAKQHAIDRAVYDRRWRVLAAALSDLKVEVLEAEVLWGSSVQRANEQLDRCVRELYASLAQYLRHQERQGPLPSQEHEEKALARFEKNFAIVFAGGSDPDELQGQVESAVGEFEQLLRPKLRLGSRAA